MHSLDPRRVIFVCYSGNLRAGNIKLVDPEELLFLGRHLTPPGFHDVGNQEHVGAVAVHLEPVAVHPVGARRSGGVDAHLEGALTRVAGDFVALLQTGRVRNYVLSMGLGAFLLLYLFLR